MSNFQNQIENLSTAEKFELLDELWNSLESSAPELTDEQSAELDRRMARYEQDSAAVLPWEQVKAGLMKKQ